MNFKNEFFKFFLRISLTGGFFFLYSVSSQAFMGKPLSRLTQLIQKASKTKGGDQLDKLAKQMGLSIDEIDPRLIEQIRETGALKNPMRLFFQPFSPSQRHPFTFKNIFYGPGESDEALLSVGDKTWSFAKRFLLIRMDVTDREQVRLFFEGMKEFANKYDNTVDMGKAGDRLIYGLGQKYEYEIKMGHLIESVVRWHGPEIQGTGALENLVERAWYKTIRHVTFLFRKNAEDVSAMLRNPFYETLLRQYFEPVMSSYPIHRKRWEPAWNMAVTFATGNKPFLLESLEGVLRKKLGETLSGNYGRESVENLFATNYDFQQLVIMAHESKQFAAFLEEIVSDFI